MIPCPSALNRRFYARDVKVAKTNLTPETLKSSVKCVFETHLKKDVKSSDVKCICRVLPFLY